MNTQLFYTEAELAYALLNGSSDVTTPEDEKALERFEAQLVAQAQAEGLRYAFEVVECERELHTCHITGKLAECTKIAFNTF